MAMFKKDLPLEEWEKIEAQKREQIRTKQEEIDALSAKRSDLLGRAEDDQSALLELEKNDARIARLRLENEATQEYLKTIPAYKSYAIGKEIEASIPGIEKKVEELPALVADINKKAAALNAANKKLFDFLSEFNNIKATESLGLQSDLWNEGFNTLSNFGSPMTPGVYREDGKVLDLDIVLMGSVYNKEQLSAWLAKIQASVSARIERMRDHAQRLKGNDVPVPELARVYCPKCYENAMPYQTGDKYRCTNCNHIFEAHK